MAGRCLAMKGADLQDVLVAFKSQNLCGTSSHQILQPDAEQNPPILQVQLVAAGMENELVCLEHGLAWKPAQPTDMAQPACPAL